MLLGAPNVENINVSLQEARGGVTIKKHDANGRWDCFSHAGRKSPIQTADLVEFVVYKHPVIIPVSAPTKNPWFATHVRVGSCHQDRNILRSKHVEPNEVNAPQKFGSQKE